MKKFRLLISALLTAVMFFTAFGSSSSLAVVNKSSAVTISTDTDVSGNLTSSGSFRDYKFTLPADGFVSISFTHDFVDNTNEFWKITLENENGKIFYDSTFVGNTSSEKESVKYGLEKGSYYIRVTSVNFSNKNYKLRVNYTAIDSWEKESNDSLETANPIGYNKEINGNIYNAIDHDWYEVELPAAGYINLVFEHTKLESSVNYWETFLYDANGNNLQNGLAYSTYAGNETGSVSGGNVGVSAGKYYIEVKSTGLFSEVNYKLTVNYKTSNAWENESNNSIADANPITIGNDAIGKITFADYDYYKINLGSSYGVKLTFTHDAVSDSGNYMISVMDENENPLESKLLSAFNRADAMTANFELPAGISYICVTTSSYNNTISQTEYKLSISLLDCSWISDKKYSYWYESGVRQGTTDDTKGVLGDGTVRGREIYDHASDGWYWLDSINNGGKAVNKEVWMPYIYQDESKCSDAELKARSNNSPAMSAYAYECMKNRTGKWVRYDAEGKMYKGWLTIQGEELSRLYPDQVGNTYYYDPVTGLMAKGHCTIAGVQYYFDPVTGAKK
ncbi:MAG: pre-peptidase C-terminal domain-containing protein [Lachnospiraceae bacterium]|nr:pre-peptidase C-terminal domain-containing protein [Lachnospiraceae bacterium]